jgi:bifunctional enzyme CysN/CysC
METVTVAAEDENLPFRMAVQWVNRPSHDFRGFAGRIAAGAVLPGDPVRILPSGLQSSVARIVTYDGDLNKAVKGTSVTLTLSHEVDVSRGDVIVAANDPCIVDNRFEAQLLWMSEKPMATSRQYIVQTATATAMTALTKIKHRVDINTLAPVAAEQLALNEIGLCEITLDRNIAFEPYATSRELGAFILIDRITNETVGAGMISRALKAASNVYHQESSIDMAQRSLMKGQKPCVIWMTGLSGAGKSTIANLVEKKLSALGKHTMLLDGDNIRSGLNRDLAFSGQDRAENIRRVAEVSNLMMQAGLITVVSFISPFEADRRMARNLIGDGKFIEVFVDAPLDVVEARDPKGLYKKARAGKIPSFTGISSPYEKPLSPELHLETDKKPAEDLADEVVRFLTGKEFLSG